MTLLDCVVGWFRKVQGRTTNKAHVSTVMQCHTVGTQHTRLHIAREHIISKNSVKDRSPSRDFCLAMASSSCVNSV